MYHHQEDGRGDDLPRTILVVEDDASIGKCLVSVLEEELPFPVKLAASGESALKLVETISPLLCLLDYHLPGMDGLTFYDHLRAIKRCAQVPALLLSADPPRREEIARRQIGSLQKPFDLEKLLYLVREMAGR